MIIYTYFCFALHIICMTAGGVVYRIFFLAGIGVVFCFDSGIFRVTTKRNENNFQETGDDTIGLIIYYYQFPVFIYFSVQNMECTCPQFVGKL